MRRTQNLQPSGESRVSKLPIGKDSCRYVMFFRHVGRVGKTWEHKRNNGLRCFSETAECLGRHRNQPTRAKRATRLGPRFRSVLEDQIFETLQHFTT